MPGPPRTPTPILKARGSWRAKLRVAEPTPSASRPTCPAWLSTEAKAEWKRVSKALEEMGLLTAVDRALLTTYCVAWAEIVDMQKRLSRSSPVLKTTGGTFYQNPLIGVRNRACERLLAVAAQFGFSPAARTRIDTHKSPKGNDDQFETFLSA